MKYTLLELVQQVITSIGGHQVNDISDTEQSTSIANIVKENYFNISGIADLPEHHDLFQLEATTSATPVVMTRPENVVDLAWVKYNTKATADVNNTWRLIQFMAMDDFLDMVQTLNATEDNVLQYDILIGSNTLNFKCNTDRPPTYYTTTNDRRLIFDAYDVAEDANLQKSKTQAYGLLSSTWVMENDYVPDMDHKQFQLLLQESKKQAASDINQVQNVNAEMKARNNWINLQRTKRNTPFPLYEYSTIRGYGRKGPSYSPITKEQMRRGS